MAESLLSYALLTEAEARAEDCLNIGTGHDDAIIRLINYVTALFEQAAGGRRFMSTKFSSLGDIEGAEAISPLDGTGDDELLLPNWPVTEIANLMVDGEAIPARPDVDSDGYVYNGSIGLVQGVGYSFTRGVQNVDITYTAGYAACPADLKLVAILEIKRAWKKAYKGEVGKSSESDPQGNRTWLITGLLPETEMVIRSYRNFGVA